MGPKLRRSRIKKRPALAVTPGGAVFLSNSFAPAAAGMGPLGWAALAGSAAIPGVLGGNDKKKQKEAEEKEKKRQQQEAMMRSMQMTIEAINQASQWLSQGNQLKFQNFQRAFPVDYQTLFGGPYAGR